MSDQKRADKDVFVTYANNVTFEMGSLDLRIIFGQGRPGIGIEPQAHVIIGWPEAKVLAHMLQVNVAIYENAIGKIRIPADTVPAAPLPPQGEIADNPAVKATYEASVKLHTDFVASLQK